MKAIWDNLKRLRQHYYNKPVFLLTHSGVEQLDYQAARPQWIVGRGLCLFRCKDFSNIPEKMRASALQTHLRSWTPFSSLGHHVVWSGSIAMVWYWDRAKVEQAIAEAVTERGLADSTESFQVLPESVFLPRGADGLSLQSCRKGVDLQAWRDGVLEGSRWFGTAPSEQDMRDFCRDHSIAEGCAAVSAPLDWASEPWRQPFDVRDWLQENENALLVAALVLISVAMVWQETRFWKATWANERVVGETVELHDEIEPLVRAKGELQALRRENRLLAGLLGQPSQAYLMMLIDQQLPSAEARFQSWDYQHNKLVLVVRDDTTDSISYVEKLQQLDLFSDVRVEQGRRAGLLQISLVVKQ